MSLASNLPITLTDGAVMGLYCRMHISSNQISCLKKNEQESGSSCGNNDITLLCLHVVTQPNQARHVLRDMILQTVQIFIMNTTLLSFNRFH